MIRSSDNIRLWYLSGGMTKFGTDEFHRSNDWRKELKVLIEEMSGRHVTALNPNDHWNMNTDPNEFTDREAMNLDIYKLRKSELVIYNNNDPYSRGSMIELGIAYQLRLPILTLNEDKQEIHPWIRCLSERIFSNRTDLIVYLREHYIGID